MDKSTIRPMEETDWEEVSRIYAEGISTGDATFESEVPSWEVWDASHLKQGRLVAEDSDKITGWAALSPVSSRCIYAGVAEVSVYVDSRARRSGWGSQLLSALIEESERVGLWTLEAGIFPENKASLRLHRSQGFRVVGTRERIGKMGDRWRDVLLLERRSHHIS